MTNEEAAFQNLIRWLVRQLVEHQIDISSIRMALKEKGLLTDFEIERHRVHLRKGLSLDQLEDTPIDKILEMLRKFSGPPQ